MVQLTGGRTRYLIHIQVASIQTTNWIDPVVAVGYDYEVNGPKVTGIELPPGIGDNMYNLWTFDAKTNGYVDSDVVIKGGEPYAFKEPVSRFSIRGIEVEAGLDPDDELTFPTGMKFDSVGEAEVSMTTVTFDTDK